MFQLSVPSYLVEGSRLWMVVMKTSTMKAHTKLDLNTSSLIWEYCNSMRKYKRRRGEEGGIEKQGFTDKHRSLNVKHTTVLTPVHAAVQTSIRDWSWRVNGGVLRKADECSAS